MRVRDALEMTARRLQEAGLDDPRMESEFLVAAALKIPRTHLILRDSHAVPVSAQSRIDDWAGERAKRQPLAYIVGEQPFMDLLLRVNASVLIPRPETELLIERAYAILDGFQGASRVADVGTGSGNIAIALARHPRVTRLVAMDISSEAIALAQANARRHGVHERCEWRLGDLLEAAKDWPGHFDLIAANLPYVKRSELSELQAEVQCEPRLALDGGESGLELIERLIPQAAGRLRTGGVLLLEIGAGQWPAVERCLEASRVWTDVRCFNDFAGWPRIVQASKGKLWTS